MLGQILQSYRPIFLIAATDYMMFRKNNHYKDNSVYEKIEKRLKKLDDFSNCSLHQVKHFESIPMRESLPGSELAKHESPRAK